MKNQHLILLALSITVLSCKAQKTAITEQHWGNIDSEKITLYTLTNSKGMVVKITNLGGIITSVVVPDKNGNMDDVVLGFDNLQQYTEPHPCFGAVIGRVANRIRNAEFTIDSVTYHLDANNNIHCSHGANEFDKTVWESEIIENELGKGIKMHYFSPDGTKGFPGNVDAYVTYNLTDDDAIHVKFEAVTDKATHINMTQHSYFNLTGCKEPIYKHIITLDADNYTEIDADIVPTGSISTVKGTDWDLTSPTPIGENIHKLNHGGYHFNYCFNKPIGEFKKVIDVYEPASGRTLEVSTTQPGVQFYSGNAISDQLIGKGTQYGKHMAFCLETQHYPNTPNCPNFPPTLIRPGEKYEEVVIYDFGVK
ncbi:aldose epimerase family protein [Saccharicrinis sp. GN24d3]|uniref:aldose epimerase family protein n=1 Tax=Saccharicrinis sp. GN24d3 TaxID=3458416 RepID=UPI0040352012